MTRRRGAPAPFTGAGEAPARQAARRAPLTLDSRESGYLACVAAPPDAGWVGVAAGAVFEGASYTQRTPVM